MCIPNDAPQEPDSHHNCDWGHHNISHSRMQELDDVVDVRTHEIDNLASLNGLLRPVAQKLLPYSRTAHLPLKAHVSLYRMLQMSDKGGMHTDKQDTPTSFA